MTASTCIAGWEAERALSDSGEKLWFFEDAQDQWVCYELTMLRAKLTRYFFRTNPKTMNPKE
jgi:hypothetical protein